MHLPKHSTHGIANVTRNTGRDPSPIHEWSVSHVHVCTVQRMPHVLHRTAVQHQPSAATLLHAHMRYMNMQKSPSALRTEVDLN